MKFYFLNIEKKYLIEGKHFSFPIFKFLSDSNKRELLINTNTPIEKNHLDKIDKTSNYSQLQIYYDSSQAYLNETQSNFKDLILMNKAKFDFLLLSEYRKKLLISNPLVKMLESCIDTKVKNHYFFKKIRLTTLKEITKFNIESSDLINATICLCEKVFTRDYKRVQVASLSYQIAKEVDITDQIILCKIILISLLRDLGSLKNDQDYGIDDYIPQSDKFIDITSNTIHLLETISLDIYMEIIEVLKFFITLEAKSNQEIFKKIYEIIITSETICNILENEDLMSFKNKDLSLNNYQIQFENNDIYENAFKKIINL